MSSGSESPYAASATIPCASRVADRFDECERAAGQVVGEVGPRPISRILGFGFAEPACGERAGGARALHLGHHRMTISSVTRYSQQCRRRRHRSRPVTRLSRRLRALRTPPYACSAVGGAEVIAVKDSIEGLGAVAFDVESVALGNGYGPGVDACAGMGAGRCGWNAAQVVHHSQAWPSPTVR